MTTLAEYFFINENIKLSSRIRKERTGNNEGSANEMAGLVAVTSRAIKSLALSEGEKKEKKIKEKGL